MCTKCSTVCICNQETVEKKVRPVHYVTFRISDRAPDEGSVHKIRFVADTAIPESQAIQMGFKEFVQE